MSPLDFKKEEKSFYLPPSHPVLADVPEMNFFMVEGEGDPNEPAGAYRHAVELLYALSYAVRMGAREELFRFRITGNTSCRPWKASGGAANTPRLPVKRISGGYP